MKFETSIKKQLSDIHTPVGIFLRVRDVFRDTILLESTDHDAGNNSKSIICINAIGGIEISSLTAMEEKLPGEKPVKSGIDRPVTELISNFAKKLEPTNQHAETSLAQGLYGYSSFDSVQFLSRSTLPLNPMAGSFH